MNTSIPLILDNPTIDLDTEVYTLIDGKVSKGYVSKIQATRLKDQYGVAYTCTYYWIEPAIPGNHYKTTWNHLYHSKRDVLEALGDSL